MNGLRLLSVILLLLLTAPIDAADRPNVVFILADDMGYSDIGCYGAEIHTPTLDRLAAKGMRFTQMHNTSKCFPPQWRSPCQPL